MKKIFTYISERHESIFRIGLFILATGFIVFLFPKEGKFKYEYQKGLPWSHTDLIAPFPFAINKSADEVIIEQSNARLGAKDYFRRDKNGYEM
ncbi:MAG: phosphohydrolase, partial [Flavobacteriales bacterium]|nr:phosphohydrolase [Flavobacteriales bacterium]